MNKSEFSTIYILVLLFFLNYAEAGSSEQLKEKYFWGDGVCNNFTIELYCNNTFSLSFVSSILERNYKGKYTEINNILILELPDDISPLSYFSNNYNIIKWDDRKYLVPERRMLEFCNYINSELEPRTELLGSYGIFIRIGDEKKSVIGKPVLPDDWNTLILNEVVQGRIKKKIDEKFGFVDMGKDKNIYTGMTLSLFSIEKEIKGYVKILSVDKENSLFEVIFAQHWDTGDILSSKTSLHSP